jgi:hypothetical protein
VCDTGRQAGAACDAGLVDELAHVADDSEPSVGRAAGRAVRRAARKTPRAPCARHLVCRARCRRLGTQLRMRALAVRSVRPGCAGRACARRVGPCPWTPGGSASDSGARQRCAPGLMPGAARASAGRGMRRGAWPPAASFSRLASQPPSSASHLDAALLPPEHHGAAHARLAHLLSARRSVVVAQPHVAHWYSRSAPLLRPSSGPDARRAALLVFAAEEWMCDEGRCSAIFPSEAHQGRRQKCSSAAGQHASAAPCRLPWRRRRPTLPLAAQGYIRRPLADPTPPSHHPLHLGLSPSPP